MKLYMDPSLLPPSRNREANSTHRLSRLDIQRASQDIKRFVEDRLERDFHLVKVGTVRTVYNYVSSSSGFLSQPTRLFLIDCTACHSLAFLTGTGVNDDLDGTKSKSAVTFRVPNQFIPRGIEVQDDDNGKNPATPYQLDCEVVQSLAKWKRFMLGHLDCPVNTGIYCDSTSIRKGYKGDVTHSAIADQWDFEVRIQEHERTPQELYQRVRTLWRIIKDAEEFILNKYPDILLANHATASFRLPRDIPILTSEELHHKYPNLDVHDRETAAVKEYGAIFIHGMGWPMADGSLPEEVRSPGYDDWNLNGDILVYHPLTEYRHELSSMGIRVDKESLLKQLEHRGMMHQSKLDFFQVVLNDRVPHSYGGGLGISRLLMLLLRTGHIGEVQVGLWHDEHFRQAASAGMDMIPDRILNLDTKDKPDMTTEAKEHADQ